MISQWINDILGVIFPNICEVCGRPLVHGENLLCLHCRVGMPVTGINGDGFSEIHKRIAAPGLPVEKAASWFRYVRDTDYARLLHRAKYGNRPAIARKLARIYAETLFHQGFFDGITELIPVPISRFKRLSRGYNQSYEIARGIADITAIPISDCLRVRRHSTQTRRNYYERWLNARSIYSVVTDTSFPPEAHLLLIDDVITSGATMVACLTELRKRFPEARLSVLSLALTSS